MSRRDGLEWMGGAEVWLLLLLWLLLLDDEVDDETDDEGMAEEEYFFLRTEVARMLPPLVGRVVMVVRGWWSWISFWNAEGIDLERFVRDLDQFGSVGTEFVKMS